MWDGSYISFAWPHAGNLFDCKEGETMHRNNSIKILESSSKREYSFENETGDAKIVVYELFPGIEVAYVSVHMDHFDFGQAEKEHREQYVGFHYCKEGRIEQEVDNEFFYLMPGDCSITLQDKLVKKFKLPMKHYHGISIGIDTAVAVDPFSEFLKNSSVSPLEVATHICGEHHSTVLRTPTPIQKILSDLYTIPETQRQDYLKIKLLELLYVLKHTDLSLNSFESNTVPRAQVEFVKQVAEYISRNINEKITVKALTQEFDMSNTYLQNAFRSVYGMPVISFIRAQKMQSAAQELIHTSKSIDMIAQEFGYENESKFSAAFKKIMGDPPSVFRKEHSKIKIL